VIKFEQKTIQVGITVALLDLKSQKGDNIMKRVPMAMIPGFAAALLMVFSASAAEKTLTGKISDSMCGASHAKMLEGHKKQGEVSKEVKSQEADRECTLACVKAGGKYVFVSQGKVYEIQNQDDPSLNEHAGHTVKLTGEMSSDGKSITVSKVEMAGGKGAQKKY
jgi:hypothetical protein